MFSHGIQKICKFNISIPAYTGRSHVTHFGKTSTSTSPSSFSTLRTHPMAPSQRFGAKILQNMGWTEGTGLGAKRDGIVEPVAVKRKRDNLGIGGIRKSPFEANPWWEKLMEEAYGAPSSGGSHVDIFEACEGRRCRPHGAAKLARIERVETKTEAAEEADEKDVNYYERGVEEAGLKGDDATQKRLRKLERLRKKLDKVDKDFESNSTDEEKRQVRDALRSRLVGVEKKLEKVIRKAKEGKKKSLHKK